MGIKNIYERFVWFDHQVRVKEYPNANKIIFGQPPKEVILFFLHVMETVSFNSILS
jgi:hypothetical protein